MERSIKQVACFFLVMFAVLIVYLTYLQFFRSEQLSAHALNRRNGEKSQIMARGNITDLHGELLAGSVPLGPGQNPHYGRVYPYKQIFAPVTGFSSAKYDKAGAESVYNKYLSGQNNPQYQLGPISALWKRNGYHVTLTVNARLQQAAYRAMGNYRGAVIVLDPRTGHILAMVSKPAYDPERIDDEWESIVHDPGGVLLNRALQGLYPPGSAIKPLLAAAALEEQVADAKKTYRSPGYLKIGDYMLHEINDKPFGDLNLASALALSSNVVFAQIGLDLGRERVGRYFGKFGFGQIPPVDFPVAQNQLPQFNRLADGELAQIAIGQGELLVTPLEMALLTAAFANQGSIMKPLFALAVTDEQGRVIKEFSPEVWLKPISSHTADLVKSFMGEVVKWGTGTAAGVSGSNIAGKTGTAENPHGAPHAWFIGFAPLEEPVAVVVVIVENGGSGGGVAAPIARHIFQTALEEG